MGEEKRVPEWEGKVSTDLRSVTAEQVWPLVEDFCSLDKWFEAVDTCSQVEGVYGEPGLTRYITTSIVLAQPPPEDADQTPKTVVKGCYEKLLSIDPAQRRLSYQITENSLGFRYYVAEWEVIDVKDGDGDGDDAGGCRIEWRFTADPMEGQTLEGFRGYIQSSLNGIAEKMGKAIQAANK